MSPLAAEGARTFAAGAAANAGALRELRACGARGGCGWGAHLGPGTVLGLLRAAPSLSALSASVRCSHATLDTPRRLLRNAAPFAPLRVEHLVLELSERGAALAQSSADAFADFASDVGAHAALTSLDLHGGACELRAHLLQ